MTNQIKDIESFLAEVEKQLKEIAQGHWSSDEILHEDWLKGYNPKFEVVTTDRMGVLSIPALCEDEKDAKFIGKSPELVSTLIRLVRIYREVAFYRGCKRDDPKGWDETYTSIDSEAQRILNDNGEGGRRS